MGYTNIDLDDELVKQAMKLSGCRSKKQVIHVALKDFVIREKRKEILQLEGKVRWEGDLDAWRKDRTSSS
ncbi:MAG: type II toxin-antitoxin system VapB family antitoxin [Acidobacteriota bacterium]